MKTTISRMIALCGAMAFLTTAHATLRDYDSFDYSGSVLPGQDGGAVWSGGWFTTGSAPENGLSNDGVSLPYPVGFESPLTAPPVSGSRVKTGGATANASTSRLLSQTIPLSVDGTVAYASALFRKNTVNGTTNADNILLEFVDAPGNRRWGFGIEGTGDKPWLNANGSTSASGPAVTVGETYLLVTKIVSSATGLDTAYLKVYGVGYGTQFPVAEPTTWDATLTETTAAVLDRIRIRIDTGNGASTPGEVDDIRVGNSWQDVVSVLEPVVDTNPPVVLTVDSLLSNTVNVIFSEPVDPTTAQNPANYTLPGNTFSAITLLAGTNVQMTVDTPIAANYILSVSNVQDIAGNPMAGTNVAGIPHGWQNSLSILITNGMAYAMHDKIVILADGVNIFTNTDHFQYVYNTVSGDFDLAVRVESLVLTDNNARTGLMARQNTFFDSPNVLIEATPARFIFQYRTNAAEATLTVPTPRPPTAFPNCWIRLVRSGAVFTGYSGTNYGVWDLIGSFDTSVGTVPYPNDILVGLVASAGNASLTTRAQFSGLGQPVFLPALTVAPAGSAVEVSWPVSSVGFTLQATPSLTPTITWTNVPGSSTTNRVFVPAGASGLFFRATHPIPE